MTIPPREIGRYIRPPRALLVGFGVVELNAVKGEWKDRRLGWINSDAIPISIPTRSQYIGRDAKATAGLLHLVM